MFSRGRGKTKEYFSGQALSRWRRTHEQRHTTFPTVCGLLGVVIFTSWLRIPDRLLFPSYSLHLVLEAEYVGLEVDVQCPCHVFLRGAGVSTHPHDAVVVESYVQPTEGVHGLVHPTFTIFVLRRDEIAVVSVHPSLGGGSRQQEHAYGFVAVYMG